MTKQAAHIIFWVIAGLEIMGHIFSMPIVDYTKPLLMPALLLYFKESVEDQWKPVYFWIVAGLLFSWGGDVSLMYTEINGFFLLGLSSFLLAHVCYIITFIKFSAGKMASLPIWIYGLLLGYLGFLSWLLVPGAGPMAVPVVVYGIVIITMLTFALRRKDSASTVSFRYTLLGATLFVISDSFIGINKFLMDVPFDRILIMSTYILGQYFIIQGLVLHIGQSKN